MTGGPIERVESIYDHIKINIEQTVKGARCTVTYDRSDHKIEQAVTAAVDAYALTIQELKSRELKVDDS